MATNRRKKRKQKKPSRRYIVFILGFLVVVLTLQTVNLYKKRADYQAQEAILTEELEKQQAKQEELEQFEQYVQTQEYIESTAKDKLGLVYENEIIFRQK